MNDHPIRRETLTVLAGSLFLSVFMQAVFLITGVWWSGMIWSNLITVAVTTLNFLLMCVDLTNALRKTEEEEDLQVREKTVKNLMKSSQMRRMIMLAAVIGVSAYFAAVPDEPVFDLWALLIPLFFVRLTLMITQAYQARRAGTKTPESPAPEDPAGKEASDD